MPNHVPERKLLFFLDDLNKKCLSGKAEIRPNASESLTIPIYESFQARLQRTLEAYDTFCGKGDIRVIATARNEKNSEFDEPSEWDKLGWTKHNGLWGKFELIDLPEPDEVAEQKLLTETAGKADILINSDELPNLAKRNDGTFRNLVENLASAKSEGVTLSSENFRDTLKGTWQRRYQRVIHKFPNAIHIYDAIELLQNIGFQIKFSTVIRLAGIISPSRLLQRIRSRWEYSSVLKQLVRTENILQPRDGQIEAKGYKVESKNYLDALCFEMRREYLSEYNIFIRSILYFDTLLTPRSFFQDRKLSFLEKVYGSFLPIASISNEIGNAYNYFGFPEQAMILFKKSIKFRNWGFSFLYGLLFRRVRGLPWIGIGNSHRQLKQYEESIDAYKKAIDLDPKYANPWNRLGDVYCDLKQYEDAIQLYKKAIALNPKHAGHWMDLGNAYRELKRPEDSIQAYGKAIKLEPKLAFPWNYLGHLYDDLDRSEDAIQAYQKAIDLDPKSAFPWHNLGNVYSNLKQYENAIQAYQKAIELDPRKGFRWNRLGVIYSITRNFERALPAYQKAVEISPEDGICRASLVGILRKLGRENEAPVHEEIARSLINKENEYNLACFESICGNVEAALRLLKIALEQKQANLDWVRQDPDFDFIRDDHRFKEIVGLE